MNSLKEHATIPDNKALSGSILKNPRYSELKRFIRVLFGRKIVLFGMVIVVILIIMAIFAPFISPYDPYDQDLAHRLESPSSSYWLGTDQLGRDELSRIVYGSRVSLMVGIIAVSTAALVGMALGLVSGFFGGWANITIMRIIDALMSIPPILLALAFAAALGGGLPNLMIAIGISMVPIYARLMRSLVLSTKSMDYITAGRVIGATNFHVMLKHILPNCFPPMIVMITLSMGDAILIEAGLSFLGLGIAPPGATWGSMVNDGYRFLLSNPILSLAPGVCIMLVVMAFNIVGDGLRDSLDPRLRGKI